MEEIVEDEEDIGNDVEENDVEVVEDVVNIHELEYTDEAMRL